MWPLLFFRAINYFFSFQYRFGGRCLTDQKPIKWPCLGNLIRLVKHGNTKGTSRFLIHAIKAFVWYNWVIFFHSCDARGKSRIVPDSGGYLCLAGRRQICWFQWPTWRLLVAPGRTELNTGVHVGDLVAAIVADEWWVMLRQHQPADESWRGHVIYCCHAKKAVELEIRRRT